MRRTWIGAAAVAALTVGATGYGVAQERQPGQDQTQTPAAHQMEKGQRAQAPGAGNMERRGERAQNAQAEPSTGQAQQQPAGAQERRESSKPAAGGTGQGAEGKAAQAAQPENRSGETNAEGTQNHRELNNAQGKQGETRPGKAAETEKGNRPEQRAGEAATTEKGARPTERTGQAAQPQNRTGGETSTRQASQAGNNEGAMPAGQSPKEQNARQGAAANGRPAGNVQAMGNAYISSASASRIANSLTATASPQNVNVDVSVGGLLPGDVDVRPLPPAVVDIVPEFRGYDYVVVHEEIYIVQPSTRRVVEIIREGGPAEAMREPGNRIDLTEAQQRLLLEGVRNAGVPEARVETDLSDGARVPADVTLEPVPQRVVAEIPMIERYRVFLANDRVVLVDPDTREVVDVVR